MRKTWKCLVRNFKENIAHVNQTTMMKSGESSIIKAIESRCVFNIAVVVIKMFIKKCILNDAFFSFLKSDLSGQL